MRFVPEQVMLPFLTNYADYLRTFVKELAEVKTYEQATAFRDKYRWRFVDSIKPPVIDKDQPDYAPSASIGVLGRIIKSALDGIRDYNYTINHIEEVKKVLTEGAQKWDGKDRWDGLSDYSVQTSSFATKKKRTNQ